MIKSFKCPDTRELFVTGKSARLSGVLKAATRKLLQFEAAATLDFLRSPPGNELEKREADRSGRHSIRVSDRWLLCFRWTDAGPEDVEIVEYRD